MEFDRHTRVAGLLGEIIAEFIRNEASATPLITVTNVTVSKDYSRATVFITTIPDTGEDDAVIFLKRKGTEIRDFIKRKKITLRTIPYFEFEIDRGERHRQHIDELVNEIHEEE